MSNAKQYIKLEFSTLENTDLSYSEMIMLSYIKGFEVLYNIKPETIAEKLSMKLSTVKANITSLKKKGLWLQSRNLDLESRNLDSEDRNLDLESRNLDEKSRNLDEKSRNLAIITPVSPMKTPVLLDSILDNSLDTLSETELETNKKVYDKENPFDIFVKEGKDEDLKFEHSLPADITEFDIIMTAIENGEEYEVVQSNTETKKLGYHYEKNKHGIWYGIKESLYNEMKEFYIKKYRELLLQQS